MSVLDIFSGVKLNEHMAIKTRKVFIMVVQREPFMIYNYRSPVLKSTIKSCWLFGIHMFNRFNWTHCLIGMKIW